ncbi:MAG: hypothetical protein HY719_17020, partial [Planctomycetes bacterium]|nr:hypothetical protein [Planctomycetota bacterium]
MTRQLEIKSFLIADYVTQDHSGKHIIVGVFDRIFSVEFPAQHNPAGIFFQFTDAEGEYQVKVQFVELQSKSSEATPEGECVLFELGTTIACDDPLSVGQVGLMIPGDGLPLPTEGAYEFRLYSNSDLVY